MARMTDTSLDAYYNIQKLSQKRKMVYDAIQELGEATNMDIADHLGWTINRITPRVLELREKGLVEVAKKQKSRQTKRLSYFWKIKD
jgi:DNA-binding MarR family transcriptional regulator